MWIAPIPSTSFDYEMNPRTLKIASGGKSDKLTKKGLPDIISRCLTKHGTKACAIMLDAIKAQGYKYSTLSAITVAVPDAIIPEEKPAILAAADKKIEKVMKNFNRGLISDEERYRSTVAIWLEATRAGLRGAGQQPAPEPPAQPHLYDVRFRCPWLYGPDQTAGRHARPAGQHGR